MANVLARFAHSRRHLVVALALAVTALGFSGIHHLRQAEAATSHLYVDLRVEGLPSVGGQSRVRVCNYGSLTSRPFVTEFWFLGRYYTANDQLNSYECSVYGLGYLGCGTAVTVIADRAYRTTGYNYGANRFDATVSC